MNDLPKSTAVVVRRSAIERVDRGTNVYTLPYIGKWNCDGGAVTTGLTVFEPSTGVRMHTHNVEESVVVIEGEAVAVIDGEEFCVEAGDTTWIPAGVPHRFANRGAGTLVILWIYGGQDVTRTMCDTGETVEHLSARDRGGERH